MSEDVVLPEPNYISVVLHVCMVEREPITKELSQAFEKSPVLREEDKPKWAISRLGARFSTHERESRATSGGLLVNTQDANAIRVVPVAQIAVDVEKDAKMESVRDTFVSAMRSSSSLALQEGQELPEVFYGLPHEFELDPKSRAFPILEIACVEVSDHMRFTASRIFRATESYVYNLFVYTSSLRATNSFPTYLIDIRDARFARVEQPDIPMFPVNPGGQQQQQFYN